MDVIRLGQALAVAVAEDGRATGSGRGRLVRSGDGRVPRRVDARAETGDGSDGGADEVVGHFVRSGVTFYR